MTQGPGILTAAVSIERQTPRRSFGDYLSNALSNAGLLIGAVTPTPVLSAAVSALKVVTGGGSQGAIPTAAPNGGGGPTPELPTGDLMSQMHSQNMEYLKLQASLQDESREFNTLTNVLKTRHETVKSTINNIR